ncbi:hypothetical protein WMY93_003901 [Mugilogobius chulae]|uniref:RETREG1-3/ARL6IP-like N-terminal reticulon-homology domain-containing protein n=1 Tax=Mugilogobius chulae TaxID=88201 RepID=A0AAW0PZI6_9GOBI
MMMGLLQRIHNSKDCAYRHQVVRRRWCCFHVLKTFSWLTFNAENGSHRGATEEGSSTEQQGSSSSSSTTTVCLRSRPCSNERDAQVRSAKAALQSRLGPYEPVITYLQAVLVWEKPVQCVILYALVNLVFW